MAVDQAHRVIVDRARSYRKSAIPWERAFDLAFDLRRPVKPRWPEFDVDSAGKPAWMPV
jgi:hypothetical protein